MPPSTGPSRESEQGKRDEQFQRDLQALKQELQGPHETMPCAVTWVSGATISDDGVSVRHAECHAVTLSEGASRPSPGRSLRRSSRPQPETRRHLHRSRFRTGGRR
jgi:hypothetical protein